jgi:putative peptide zinc metalloprotease protein
MENILHTNIVPQKNNNITIHFRDNEYVVTLEESNFHIKISSKLFHLLKLVDNKKPISEIVNDFNKSFENKIDNTLAYDLLYNKLGHYNIIETGKSNFNKVKPAYLKLNTIILNDRITKRLSKPFFFLFSKLVLRVFIPLCFAIIGVTFILNYSEIYENVKQISAQYFALYIVLMLFSTFFHELGHATATYKFGGKHSGIGIGFYLFTPVMYADVSSAWEFDIRKRIIVNLAGIYFELLFGTILILISLTTAIKPLLIIPSIILIKTVFNLNPFLRTDGYWVLSDAIKTPNLRGFSNKLLKSLIINKFQQKISKKEVFIILYAIISNSFILMLLFYLFVKNPNSLLTFPVDIYNYIGQIINQKRLFKIRDVSAFLVPITFYLLAIRVLLNYLKKRNEKN